MSDTSWILSAAGQQRLTTCRRDTELLRSLLPLIGDWLPRQRWFAGKGRPVHDVSVLSDTVLAASGAGGTSERPADGVPGLLHLLLRVQHAAGPASGDCYQLLLGTRSSLPSVLNNVVVGRIDSGPLDGLLVYDALHDTELSSLLLSRLSEPTQVGTLSFHRLPDTDIPTHLPARVSTAEQSNTSVVYGDSLILKLFRRVSPGVNPDLELPLTLAGAGCTRVPAPLAWLETRWPDVDADRAGETTTLGLLQPYLPGSTDGWQLALASVRRASAEQPPTPPAEDFTAESFLLGQATAEVHTVLAQALPGASLGHAQIEQMAAGMSERLDTVAAAVPALQPYRAALHTAYTELAGLAGAGRTLTAQRIHGDLHLGQALRTTNGWVLIDFEGEPAGPLVERRRPQPAIRDVAAMLRSFDYAAHYCLVAEDSLEAEVGPAATERADDWARRNRAAFCAGYATSGDYDPRSERVLLRAFEIDKAVYEVLYEARHRPSWLPIPMSAIKRLAARS